MILQVAKRIANVRFDPYDTRIASHFMLSQS